VLNRCDGSVDVPIPGRGEALVKRGRENVQPVCNASTDRNNRDEEYGEFPRRAPKKPDGGDYGLMDK
jgi:hypothetical protein